MIQENHMEVLAEVFRRLPDKARERLRYHYDRNTSICCGADYEQYTNGAGGG